ncbi:hypothetical protein Q4Q39_06780 [Flavivirga amylovorans]|uniref:FLYWCH-type domain-containing protein n=1 Tax=Flavivirga amylovorans TaxID=870486 RepID=A0ABT8X034_9FLAO|nr:hypothetical protein [Flavivirga amylovorans]MDO5987112.1 hypothetical protein [Flavivirga amylovorans]
MKLLYISSSIIILLFFTSFNNSNVYICKGKGSKRYHYTKHCRGLSNCSTKVYEVKLSKAKALKRTLCGWED